MGTRILIAEALRVLICRSSPGVCHFHTKTWSYPTTYRLPCWNASGQTTSRRVTQGYSSADRLHKVIMSSQPPLKTNLDTTLPTRGTIHSSTHQLTSTSLSHQEAYTSPRTKHTHQGADTRGRRSYSPTASKKETTNTESQTK